MEESPEARSLKPSCATKQDPVSTRKDKKKVKRKIKNLESIWYINPFLI